jgi:hypothetical protein
MCRQGKIAAGYLISFQVQVTGRRVQVSAVMALLARYSVLCSCLYFCTGHEPHHWPLAQCPSAGPKKGVLWVTLESGRWLEKRGVPANAPHGADGVLQHYKGTATGATACTATTAQIDVP